MTTQSDNRNGINTATAGTAVAVRDISPETIRGHIAAFGRQVGRFKSGEIGKEEFKSARLSVGIYSQRQSGYFLVRTKLPGGTVPINSIARVADIAEKFSDKRVHITTRQNWQLYNVALDSLEPSVRALAEAGIYTVHAGGNTVRNVTVCDFSGSCRKELFDVTSVSEYVSDFFLFHPNGSKLPRKFKVTFAGCEDDCGGSFADDFGVIAQTKNGEPGFRIYAGGGLGAVPRLGALLEEFIPAREILRSILAAVRLFNKHGNRINRNRARLKFVIEKHGFAKVAEMYRAELADVVKNDDAPLVPDSLFAPPAHGQNGSARLLIKVPVGDLPVERLRALAKALQPYESHETAVLRNTKSADIVLSGLSAAELAVAESRLNNAEFDIARLDAFVCPTAAKGMCLRSCHGATTCSEGITNSHGMSVRIAELLRRRDAVKPGSLNVHVSGCPNACGQHHTADIGLQGSAKRVEGRLVPHYVFYLGGKRTGSSPRLAVPTIRVPAKNVPQALTALLDEFERDIKPGESAADAIVRNGTDHYENIIGKFVTIPSHTADPAAYLDWDAAREFSLEDVGPGECGGSAIDIIDTHFDHARHNIALAKKAADGNDIASAARLAHSAGLDAVKAMLVSFGVDPATEEEAFREFNDRLIIRGLVSDRHKPQLAALDTKLDQAMDNVTALIAAHNDLIEDSLASYTAILAGEGLVDKPAQSAGSPQANEKPVSETVKMDLSGVLCPFNYIKIKLVLEEKPVGTVVEAILDPGKPVENVPASLRNDGHTVVSLEQAGEKYRLVVRKS